MFELLLNAITIALSKDTREGISTIVDLLRRSPDWQKEICTIEARISFEVRERIDLLEDIISEKLESLEYQIISIQAFRTAIHELATNAFEHGRSQRLHSPIRIIVDITPTYVAVSVINPKGSKIKLSEALSSGMKYLKKSGKMGRGRGLLTVCRSAVVVMPIGNEGVKALVYRDVVEINDMIIDNIPVVMIENGHSNPSLGRRLIDHLEEGNYSHVVVCFDLNEIELCKKMEKEYIEK